MEKKEITIEKVYDASRERVWKAWTDPKELVKWWGPQGVSIPTSEVDLRVGGKFYIVMEAGEAMGPYKGTLWPMDAEYTVIEPNARIAYKAFAWTEGKKETTNIDQDTDIRFTKDGNKTKVV